MRALLLALPLITLACGPGGAPLESPRRAGFEPVVVQPPRPVAPQPPASLYERLGEDRRFQVEPGDSVIQLTAQGGFGDPTAVAISPATGTLVVHRGRSTALVVSAVSLGLDDVLVSPAAFPPDGLHITGIQAELKFEDVLAAWSADGASAQVRARASLYVEWALVTSTGQLPIRPLRLAHLPIEAELVTAQDGRAGVILRTAAVGLLAEWNVVAVSDLTFELVFWEATLD